MKAKRFYSLLIFASLILTLFVLQGCQDGENAVLGGISGLPLTVKSGQTYYLEVKPTNDVAWGILWTSNHDGDSFGSPTSKQTSYTPSQENEITPVVIVVSGYPLGGDVQTAEAASVIQP